MTKKQRRIRAERKKNGKKITNKRTIGYLNIMKQAQKKKTAIKDKKHKQAMYGVCISV